MLDLIKGLYHLRNCNYDLSKEKIENGKYSVCLEYHLGNCKGACEGYETEAAYNVNIKAIKEILKGNQNTLFGEIVQNFNQTNYVL